MLKISDKEYSKYVAHYSLETEALVQFLVVNSIVLNSTK